MSTYDHEVGSTPGAFDHLWTDWGLGSTSKPSPELRAGIVGAFDHLWTDWGFTDAPRASVEPPPTHEADPSPFTTRRASDRKAQP